MKGPLLVVVLVATVCGNGVGLVLTHGAPGPSLLIRGVIGFLTLLLLFPKWG